jgi:plasmid maintenance system killer protein
VKRKPAVHPLGEHFYCSLEDMELHFKSRKLCRACLVEVDSIRMWGPVQARIVRRRVAEVAAAENLAVIATLPTARLHTLTGDREGQFAIDVKHPFRLILEPLDEIPRLPDGGVDLRQINAIRILEIRDYHGH